MASINLQGDTSGAITISAPSVAGSHTLTLPATTQTVATQNALGVRNLIINGDMNIAQRGTSATGKTTSGYYTCDRWYNVFSGAGTWTFTQDTDVPSGQGFSSSLKMDCTTANASIAAADSFQLHTRFEGQNLQHLKKGTSNAETITLSFWVKSNKTGTYQVNLDDRDNTRIIGKTYSVDAANTWEKKTLTFAGDTTGAFDNDNNNSLRLIWWFASGSNYNTGSVPTSWEATDTTDIAAGLTVNLADSTSNYINITGVQLEVGDTATPFEHRPYDMELARCQRYYENNGGGNNSIWSGYCTNGNTYYLGIPFKVTKRTTPSCTFTSVGVSSFPTTGGINNVNTFGLIQYRTANGTNTQGLFQSSITADAEL